MDFFEVIKARRSIRKYDRRPVEEGKIEQMVESVLRAPSSRGRRPWEFVIVTDQKTMLKLAVARSAEPSFLVEAPLAIVVCADERVCDVWIEDASIACTYILLTAQALGLGGCWLQIRERKHPSGKGAEEYVREMLDLPHYLRVQAIIAVGYPAEEKDGYSREELPFGKIHRHRYTFGE